jgi:hypothetical protein
VDRLGSEVFEEEGTPSPGSAEGGLFEDEPEDFGTERGVAEGLMEDLFERTEDEEGDDR